MEIMEEGTIETPSLGNENSVLSDVRKKLGEDWLRRRRKYTAHEPVLDEGWKKSSEERLDIEESALEKLTMTALRYDRRSVQANLNCFESTELTYEEFGSMLRRLVVDEPLTKAEVSALAKMFTSWGHYVDGPQFLCFFWRAGNEARSQEFARRSELNATQLQRRNILQAHVKATSTDDVQIHDDSYFIEISPQESPAEIAAWKRLAKVQWGSSRHSQAEDTARRALYSFLKPSELRYQLDRSFAIRLTQTELTAICSRFRHRHFKLVDGRAFQLAWSSRSREARSSVQLNQTVASQRRKSTLTPTKLLQNQLNGSIRNFDAFQVKATIQRRATMSQQRLNQQVKGLFHSMPQVGQRPTSYSLPILANINQRNSAPH